MPADPNIAPALEALTRAGAGETIPNLVISIASPDRVRRLTSWTSIFGNGQVKRSTTGAQQSPPVTLGRISPEEFRDLAKLHAGGKLAEALVSSPGAISSAQLAAPGVGVAPLEPPRIQLRITCSGASVAASCPTADLDKNPTLKDLIGAVQALATKAERATSLAGLTRERPQAS
jgi:hypothetical protein